MEKKYTPGPWREGQEGNLRIYGPDCMGDHSGLLAVVYKGRANAHLISAAPDLLEALEELMDFGCPVCLGDCSSANPPITNCPTQKARAAIAKAYGRG